MDKKIRKLSPEALARKQARIERWRRPLTTRWDRIRAWTNMLTIDHAFFRLVYPNMHKISDKAWRMAQPLPHHIHRFAAMGGRSVVSLRGGQTFGSLPLEIEACAKAGLSFHTLVMRSRMLPSRPELLGAAELFERLEYPVLFHCKSGADRAGFVSVLYLALHEGVPVSEARTHLSLRYGHIKQGKTGVLDAFFDAYEADTGGEIPLMDWIKTRYNRDRITAAFKSRGWADLITDRVLARE